MELRVLRYFLAVAREESISGAAEYLHLTQPTLSRQLIELEEELGKKLFVRGSRRISLTEDGLLLRKRAGEIIDLVEKTESEFRETDESISGDIYIGGGESDSMRMVARIARELQAAYPNIRYHLYSGNAEDVTDRLDKGLLDFGILIQPTDIKKYDSLSLPFQDTWGVLMRNDSLLAEKESIRPGDLYHLPLIISRQTLVKDDLSKWFQYDMDRLHIVSTYNLLYNASLMVDEGLGYALCLDKIINTKDSNLCFRPLEPRVNVGLSIVWKKYQVFSKATEKFLDLLHLRFKQEK